MVTVYWKLDHKPFVQGGANEGYPTTNTLEYYRDVVISTATGDSKDSFKLKMDYRDDGSIPDFLPKDKLVIYRQVDSNVGWSTEDILMNGTVRTVPSQENHQKDELSIEGYNHSETVMGSLIFIDATNGLYNVPEFIEACLLNATQYNKSFKVTWHPDNPTTKSDGEAFPDVNEYAYYKPLSYILEKYSGRDYTDDTNYYWYVDQDNFLVWRPRGQAVSFEFDETTDEHLMLKVTKDTNDIKNFVIVKAGLDPNNKPIQALAPDFNSIAKNGFKYHFLVDENKTARSTYDADLSRFEVDSMEDATYPLTPIWSEGTSYANYDDYVAGFRNYIKLKAKELGTEYIDLRSNGKAKVDLEFIAGTKNWRIGDLISCNIPKLSNSNSKPMRVENAQYTTAVDTFTLVEDFGTL